MDSIKYRTTSDNTVEVYGSKEGIVNANIPATVANYGTTYSVTGIGSVAFMSRETLTSVTIPHTVTGIGGGYATDFSYFVGAFAGCSGLTSVTLLEGVTSIGFAAFLDCKSISSIIIPSSVVSIGDNAFANCSKLKKVSCLAEVPPTLGFDCFNNTPANKTLAVPCNSIEAYNDSDWILHFVNIICDNLCDKPTNVAVSDVTENGATISWIGTADNYELQLNDGEIEMLAAKTKTYTDLQPATFYQLKVRAVCSESNSEWVTAMFFETMKGESGLNDA